jgi:O-antigen ligase
MWMRLVTVFLPLCLFFNDEVQKRAMSSRLFQVLPWTALAGALALGVELALGGPLLKLVRGPMAQLFQYNRGFSYLVLLAFPILAALWISKRRWLLVALILILFIPSGLTESRAAKLALVAGLIVTLAAHFLPRITRYALSSITILSLGWPFAAQKIFLLHRDWAERLPHSWADRMEIWDYTSYRILDRPWFGWGLGSSPTLPVAEPHGSLYLVEGTAAAHPHNAVSQLWVELGVFGLAAGGLMALLVLYRASKLKPSLVPFAYGAWMASFCLAMIAYNFWSDSLWAAFALTGFAFAMLQKQALVKKF